MFATVLHVVCVGFFLLHTLHIDFVCLLSDSEPVDLTMSSPERGPSLERFYGRDKVSDDVSDLEGELIEHTTAVVRERIEQRSETLIADIWTQSKQEVTKVKEGKVKRKVKRRRKRGHDWSKKGTKASRKARSQYKTPDKRRDTYFFTRARVGPAYAARCAEYSLSPTVGGTVAQFIEWIRSDPKSSTLDERCCCCPCCPYSTGPHLLQRQLLLRRLYQLHKFS